MISTGRCHSSVLAPVFSRRPDSAGESEEVYVRASLTIPPVVRASPTPLLCYFFRASPKNFFAYLHFSTAAFSEGNYFIPIN
jgi:hypothetical protein